MALSNTFPEYNYIFSNDLCALDLFDTSYFTQDKPSNTPSTDEEESVIDPLDYLSYPPSPSTTTSKPKGANTTAQQSKFHYKQQKPAIAKADPDNDYELRISAGMELVKSGSLSIRAAAKKVHVSHETLRRRYQGACSRQEFHTQLMALSPAEEQIIENMLLTFLSYSNMLTSSFLCNLVNDYRRNKAAATDSMTKGKRKPVKDLGISWTAGFRRRHELISEIMAKSMNKDKQEGLVKSSLDQWFQDVADGFAKYNITSSENVYNLVELGFYTEPESSSNSFGCVKRADAKSQDPDISFSIFEAICSDGSVLPSQVIVKKKQSNQHRNQWGNSSSFLHWLETIFESHSKVSGSSSYRAIFLDACPALFSSKVLQYALDHNIVFYLFPHNSSYVFQPMDSVIIPSFKSKLQTLSKASSNDVVSKDSGISKDKFLAILNSTRFRSTTFNDVMSAWKKTGLNPLDPSQLTNSKLPVATYSSSSSLSSSPASTSLATTFSNFPETVTMAMVSKSCNLQLPFSQLKHRLRRNLAINENLSALGSHYKTSLDRYLESRPPLYYADGTRADAEDGEYLRLFMGECWSTLDKSVQCALDDNKRILELYNDLQ